MQIQSLFPHIILYIYLIIFLLTLSTQVAYVALLWITPNKKKKKKKKKLNDNFSILVVYSSVIFFPKRTTFLNQFWRAFYSQWKISDPPLEN